MNNLVQSVNSAVFNYIKEPFTVVALVFALLTAAAAVFVALEIIKKK